MTKPSRPNFFAFHNGSKSPLQFEYSEYLERVSKLRLIMASKGIDAALMTSMQNVAYYSGFLYCSFGRPYGCVITEKDMVIISAGIDAGQPWRRCAFNSITYTDWERDNFWRAVLSVIGSKRTIGYEGDHITLQQMEKLTLFLSQ